MSQFRLEQCRRYSVLSASGARTSAARPWQSDRGCRARRSRKTFMGGQLEIAKKESLV